jgi:acetylornithine deacetylase
VLVFWALHRGKKIKATLGKTKEHAGLPMETNFKLPLVQQFFQTTGQTKPIGVDYFCDASILSHGGIPSIVFGPGDIAQAHTTDEWISIKSLERATLMLVKFLESLP